MKNKLFKILLVIILISYLVLFIFDIKSNIVYLVLLIFEIFILSLCGFRYKNGKKVKLEIITVISNIFLFITLLVGLISTKILINDILIKALLTITIIFQVLSFLKLNNNFSKLKD